MKLYVPFASVVTVGTPATGVPFACSSVTIAPTMGASPLSCLPSASLSSQTVEPRLTSGTNPKSTVILPLLSPALSSTATSASALSLPTIGLFSAASSGSPPIVSFTVPEV